MQEKIKIAVDAMGGENSPKKIINGIINNQKQNKITSFLILQNRRKHMVFDHPDDHLYAHSK